MRFTNKQKCFIHLKLFSFFEPDVRNVETSGCDVRGDQDRKLLLLEGVNYLVSFVLKINLRMRTLVIPPNYMVYDELSRFVRDEKINKLNEWGRTQICQNTRLMIN